MPVINLWSGFSPWNHLAFSKQNNSPFVIAELVKRKILYYAKVDRSKNVLRESVLVP